MDTQKISQRWEFLLSEKQRDFIQAYMVTQSAAAACEMLEIPRSAGSRFLASPRVITALKLAQKQTRELAVVTPEEVITDLRLIRDQSLGRIPIPETKWIDGQPVTKYVRQYNSGAASKAVENLGRVVGMFTDKKEIVIPATDKQLEKRLSELLGADVSLSANTVDGEYSEVPKDAEIDTAEPESDTQVLSEAFEALSDKEITGLMLEVAEEERAKRS